MNPPLQEVSTLVDASTVAAIASAVAAVMAAVAAFLSWRTQVASLRLTVTPEIVLEGWRRTGDRADGPWIVQFTRVRNTGRGRAAPLVLNTRDEPASGATPTYLMSTINLPSLAAGEGVEVDGSIVVFWKNVSAPQNGPKFLSAGVKVMCWDSVAQRHATTVSLMLVENDDRVFSTSAKVAPGAFVTRYVTRTQSVPALKAQRHLSRIPLFGRLFRDDW